MADESDILLSATFQEGFFEILEAEKQTETRSETGLLWMDGEEDQFPGWGMIFSFKKSFPLQDFPWPVDDVMCAVQFDGSFSIGEWIRPRVFRFDDDLPFFVDVTPFPSNDIHVFISIGNECAAFAECRQAFAERFGVIECRRNDDFAFHVCETDFLFQVFIPIRNPE